MKITFLTLPLALYGFSASANRTEPNSDADVFQGDHIKAPKKLRHHLRLDQDDQGGKNNDLDGFTPDQTEAIRSLITEVTAPLKAKIKNLESIISSKGSIGIGRQLIDMADEDSTNLERIITLEAEVVNLSHDLEAQGNNLQSLELTLANEDEDQVNTNSGSSDKIQQLERCMANPDESSTSTDLVFRGCNIHVQNGHDSTSTATQNSLGNLIIGYNENGFDFPRGGSHNLVVGKNHGYTSYGGVVAGERNQITGPYSSVSGGISNKASGDFSFVIGGFNNTAWGLYSLASGGMSNTASGQYSSISGGRLNTASGGYSSVSGGYNNTASGISSSVSGGLNNTASYWYSSVSGGKSNTASGYLSSVSGGKSNTASDHYSSILG